MSAILVRTVYRTGGADIIEECPRPWDSPCCCKEERKRSICQFDSHERYRVTPAPSKMLSKGSLGYVERLSSLYLAGGVSLRCVALEECSSLSHTACRWHVFLSRLVGCQLPRLGIRYQGYIQSSGKSSDQFRSPMNWSTIKSYCIPVCCLSLCFAFSRV